VEKMALSQKKMLLEKKGSLSRQRVHITRGEKDKMDDGE
jgi:hypothetical protein